MYIYCIDVAGVYVVDSVAGDRDVGIVVSSFVGCCDACVDDVAAVVVVGVVCVALVLLLLPVVFMLQLLSVLVWL